MLRTATIRIFMSLLLGSMSLAVIPQPVSAQYCACGYGQVSDQGCMAAGCPTGTRRVCNCTGGSGGACIPQEVESPWGTVYYTNVWSCFCQPDATCSTGNPGDPVPDPGCTNNPTPATNLQTRYPNTTSDTAPGRTLKVNALRVRFNAGGGGGGGCTVVGHDLQIRPQDNSTPWVSYGNVTSVDNLAWNTAYKWRIRTINSGGRTANSDNSFFTTGVPPVISNFSVTSLNSCSATPGYVGTSANGANNPLVIQFDITDQDNDFASGVNVFRNTRIGLSPMTNDFRRFDQLEPTLHQPATKTSAGFRAVNLNNFLDDPNISFSSTDYSDGSTGGTTVSGNRTNAAGNATLLDINGGGAYSTTITQVNNQTLRVRFVVRLENSFANGSFNIFAAVVARKSDYISGGVPQVNINITQDPNPFNELYDANLRYRNFSTTGATTSQLVDMVSPSVSVGNPQATNVDTFSVNWAASDANGLALLRSYCYLSSGVSATIRDLGLATNISIGNTELNYPSADNCLVNSIARLGNRSYQDLSGAISPGINLRLYAVDNACNSAQATNFTLDNRPWISTGNGVASANGGFNSFTIRDTAYNFNNLTSTLLTPPPHLATYIAISGNAAMVNNKASRSSISTTNYTDNKFIPQVTGGLTSWRSTIHGIIMNQSGYSSLITNSFAAGNLSTRYGVAANATVYRYHTGNLTLASGVICNIKAVIVVQGNLTIAPNLTVSPINTNGCIFVVGGDIIVQQGTHASAGGTQQYDTLHGLFVTDGAFRTLPVGMSADRPLTNRPADGLYIRGGVVAKTVDFRRDMGGANNPTYPAEIIEYDPFYMATFGDVLSSKKFSVRQN